MGGRCRNSLQGEDVGVIERRPVLVRGGGAMKEGRPTANV